MGSLRRVICRGCVLWLPIGGAAQAQTVEGSILRGQGAYLRGAGRCNLRTAEAASINPDATIRWREDLRKIQQERRILEAEKDQKSKLSAEEGRRRVAQREQELRTNPSPNDVQSGAALSALIYDLTDPDIESSQWNSLSIPLPPGTS